MFSTDTELAATLRANVIDALGPHEPGDAARIAVDVNGSRAVLHGCVRSWAEREALDRAALATPGVTRVDNQLALLVKGRLTGPRFHCRV